MNPQELFFAAVAKETPIEVYRLIHEHTISSERSAASLAPLLLSSFFLAGYLADKHLRKLSFVPLPAPLACLLTPTDQLHQVIY
jgi:hypothetical protein